MPALGGCPAAALRDAAAVAPLAPLSIRRDAPAPAAAPRPPFHRGLAPRRHAVARAPGARRRPPARAPPARARARPQRRTGGGRLTHRIPPLSPDSMSLFTRKSIDELQQDATAEGHHSLRRALGPLNLVTLGIGAIIGTGIFVLTGTAAAQHAGPAIVLAFVLAGLGCVFAGLCYAEFASMIPIAGSAYTYGYATLGEFMAWVIGWDLILEYLFGAATVAAGWSGYVNSFLKDVGIVLPPSLTNPPGALVQPPGSESWVRRTDELAQSLAQQGVDINALPQASGGFNVIAALGILVVTVLLIRGIKESARFNNAAVVVKLAVVGLFIAAGGYYVLTHLPQAIDNWTPFIPDKVAPRT